MYKIRLKIAPLIISFIGTLSFVGSVYAHHLDEKTIAKRTKPSGKVYRVGDNIPTPAVAIVNSAGGNRSGEQIYTEKCALCHTSGIAGSPKLGDSAAWSERIAQGEETLYSHAIKGFQGKTGIMPAKGGCVDCSDDEIKSAVIHMIKASK